MLNRINFIPKQHMQPNHYEKLFSGWCAVYYCNGTEYHIQLNPDPYDDKYVKSVEVLKQFQSGRSIVKENIQNLNQAIKVIENLKSKERKYMKINDTGFEIEKRLDDPIIDKLEKNHFEISNDFTYDNLIDRLKLTQDSYFFGKGGNHVWISRKSDSQTVCIIK